jgi:hypothetical protein
MGIACPRCQSSMREIMRIAPLRNEPGLTYECPACEKLTGEIWAGSTDDDHEEDDIFHLEVARARDAGRHCSELPFGRSEHHSIEGMPLSPEQEAICERLEKGESSPEAAALIRHQAHEIDDLWDRLSRASADFIDWRGNAMTWASPEAGGAPTRQTPKSQQAISN